MKDTLNKINDKLFVKWRGYNNSFNSWINKKRCNKIYIKSIIQNYNSMT